MTVLCGLPNYPEGKIFKGYSGKGKRYEIIDGVEVIRCWQIPRGNNVFQLSLNYISYWFNAKRHVDKLKDVYDIVLSYQLSPITSAFPAIQYAKKYNVPSVVYCLDLWPESIKANVANDKNPIFKIVHAISKKVYAAFDMVLVSSPPFNNYLQDVNGISKNKIEYLPQHGDSEMLSKDFSREEDGITNFMFAGNLGMAQTLDVIIKAASLLGKRDDYKIHFVGDGSRRQMAESLTSQYELKNNIVFHGKHSRSEMANFYKMADVLLITLRGNNAVGLTIPGKLQTYMATGKPILGAINGATPNIVKEAECGACVAAGDYEGLSLLMKDVIENREKYKTYGKNARKYFIKNFSLEVYTNRLLSIFQKLTN